MLGFVDVGCPHVVPITDHGAGTDFDELVDDGCVHHRTRMDLTVEEHDRVATKAVRDVADDLVDPGSGPIPRVDVPERLEPRERGQHRMARDEIAQTIETTRLTGMPM